MQEINEESATALLSNEEETKLRISAQEMLLRKCKEYELEAKQELTYEGDDTYVRVEIPNGREVRVIRFHNRDRIESAIDNHFEEYCYLGDYEAIMNTNTYTIEAVIGRMGGNSYAYQSFSGDDRANSFPLILNSPDKKIEIVIGEPSEAMKVFVPRLYSSTKSLTISGIEIKTHDEALGTLERIANALFFQIDLQNDRSYSLRRVRRRRKFGMPRSGQSGADLKFPTVGYDNDPISLYWYARSATGMPLLQFLAFYQVIEYYFPTYSVEEAKRRIQTILKDPLFRYERDMDIGRILSVVSKRGKGFGTEKDQLRATIDYCINPIELRAFFEESEDRKQFFSKKQKGLTDIKLPISEAEADLRNPTSDLIYDIRCKIVHTKIESLTDKNELLLPFSKEAELLTHDIELVQFIARKVLIVASSPMSL